MGYWDRYRFGNKGYSLSIERLECEDQGTYMCKAVNGFGVHEISFQLDLLGIFQLNGFVVRLLDMFSITIQ